MKNDYTMGNWQLPPMINLVFGICLLACTIQAPAGAQTTNSEQTMTFSTANQSIFGPNSATTVDKRFNLLADNGVDASFLAAFNANGKACFNGEVKDVVNGAIDAVNGLINTYNTLFNPDLATIATVNEVCFGGDVALKMGLKFDVYVDVLISSGDVDITYPVKVTFTYPTANTFGCGNDVIISTSFLTESGYSMDLLEPIFSVTAGTTVKPGFYAGGEACVVSCFPLGTPIDIGSPSFKDVTTSNYQSHLTGGDYNLFRLSTSEGVLMPWGLLPQLQFLQAVLNLPGNYPLPLSTSLINGFEDATNISGDLYNPFANLDGNDALSGTKLSDNSTNPFAHIEFDPIQFQEYLTGIPLTFSQDFGAGVSAEFTAFSAPLVLDVNQKHTFEMTPGLVVDLNLGRVHSWEEWKGNTLVKSGNSQTVTGFTIGNDLKLKNYPDNVKTTVLPTFNINANFKSKIQEEFDVSLEIELLSGSVTFPTFDAQAMCNDLIDQLGIPDVSFTFTCPLCCPCSDGNGPDPCILLYTCDKTVNIRDAFEAACSGLGNITAGGEISFGPVWNPTFPIANAAFNVLDKNFTLGGFNTVNGSPFDIQPDNIPPVVATQNITRNLSASFPGSASIIPQDVVASAVDNEGGVIQYVSVSPSAFDCNTLGENTVTVVVTDSRCNETTMTATVTIQDITPPTAICQNLSIDLQADGSAAIVEADIDNGSYDNCVANLSLDVTAFDCADVGTNTVILTVSDNGSNATTCTATVTLTDATVPTVVCKNVTVYLDEIGEGSISTSDVDDGSSDACGIQSMVLTQTAFDCTHLGNNLVTMTVTDNNNNVNTCEVTVNVVDNMPPDIFLLAETSMWPPNHEYETLTIEDMVSAVYDNCDDALIIQSVSIDYVSSDEPEDETGEGDGNTLDDFLIGLDCQSVDLRKERANNGNGRVYTVGLTLTDVNGNTGTANYLVRVNPNSSGPAAVDNGVSYSEDCSGNNAIVVNSTNPTNSGLTAAADNESSGVSNDQQPLGNPVQAKGVSVPTRSDADLAKMTVFPNPFGEFTTIRFEIPLSGKAKLEVYNLHGQLISRLLEQDLDAGTYDHRWDGKTTWGQKLPSGMYLIKLTAGKTVLQQRVMLR